MYAVSLFATLWPYGYFLNGNFRDAFFINDFIRLSGLINTEPFALWSYFHSSLAFISCMISTLLMDFVLQLMQIILFCDGNFPLF